MKKLLLLSLMSCLFMYSCTKDSESLIQPISKIEIQTQKDLVYENFNEIHSVLSQQLSGSSDVTIPEIHELITTNLNELGFEESEKTLQNVELLVEGKHGNVEYENNNDITDFISSLKASSNEFRTNQNYELYIDQILNINGSYHDKVDPVILEEVAMYYGSVVPYWIENSALWDALNYKKGACDRIPEAALESALIGCGVGALAGSPGGPPGSLAACIVGGVLSATAVTLWTAIKCAAEIIYETYFE